jgi:medium-chain acyl-[acyl-carrier-protein] hydrolase
MKNPWIAYARPTPEPRPRLFCFPYAGGSATMYINMVKTLGHLVEVCPVELPGRGARLRETPIDHLPTLVAALSTGLRPLLDRPFAFFGHSMGALLAFELTRTLRRQGGPLPGQLLVSAHRGPQLPRTALLGHGLSDTEMLDNVRGLGGTPPDVLAHPELLEMILPIIRADFELVDTYHYQAEPPLPCPILAFGGMTDALVSRTQLEGWREQTEARFSLQMFPGGHFYLQSAEPLFVGVVSRALTAPASAL